MGVIVIFDIVNIKLPIDPHQQKLKITNKQQNFDKKA